jgi:hypothetical protein
VHAYSAKKFFKQFIQNLKQSKKFVHVLESLLHDCTNQYFACLNPTTKGIERCIARNWVCDGEPDCKHGDDEPAYCGERDIFIYWVVQ